MDGSQRLYDLLKDLLVQLPSLVALTGCMIFAIVRWKRQPKVSLVVVLSLGLLMVHTVVSEVIYTWVPDWFIQSASHAATDRAAQNIYLVLGLAANGITAVALAWLLAAIFMQRRSANNMS